MAGHTRTPGARDSATGGHDRKPIEQIDPYDSPTRSNLQASAAVDRLLVRLSDRLQRPGLTDFEAGFCKSLLRQARRGGPRWRPSERQQAVAEGILASHDDEPEESLIEEDLPDGWIP